MSPKKGDRVSVPPLEGWNVIYGTTEAAVGWEELCRAALANTHRCLEALRTDPRSHADWNRQHSLRGGLKQREWKGRLLDRRHMRPPTYTALHTALGLPPDNTQLLASDEDKPEKVTWQRTRLRPSRSPRSRTTTASPRQRSGLASGQRTRTASAAKSGCETE